MLSLAVEPERRHKILDPPCKKNNEYNKVCRNASSTKSEQCVVRKEVLIRKTSCAVCIGPSAAATVCPRTLQRHRGRHIKIIGGGQLAGVQGERGRASL